ncbi:MAG: hypothetical protein OEM02_00030 [Desulfobulbaceae bacterium]|nr:hypothetical protein [Desulfobulbaceae bacterium]
MKISHYFVGLLMAENRIKAISLSLLLLVLLCGCCGKENLYKGVFNSSNKVQEMKSMDDLPPPDKEAPDYEQYRRERDEILKNQNDKLSK